MQFSCDITMTGFQRESRDRDIATCTFRRVDSDGSLTGQQILIQMPIESAAALPMDSPIKLTLASGGDDAA